MPSWRPAGAGDPDEEHEWRFKPLVEQDPDVAAALLEAYGHRWLEKAELSLDRMAEVPDTVDLVVAEDWTEPEGSGLMVLRFRSWYTGSTYWLREWDGTYDSASYWIIDVADLQAGNVMFERDRYGPTPWDDD
jgi:hypothetical protein